MPKIYEYLGFIFFFYTNEHLPVHIHVSKGERESKCELLYEGGVLNLKWKKVKGKKPLLNSEKKSAEEFTHQYHFGIVNKWNQVFVFNQKVACEKIKKLK